MYLESIFFMMNLVLLFMRNPRKKLKRNEKLVKTQAAKTKFESQVSQAVCAARTSTQISRSRRAWEDAWRVGRPWRAGAARRGVPSRPSGPSSKACAASRTASPPDMVNSGRTVTKLCARIGCTSLRTTTYSRSEFKLRPWQLVLRNVTLAYLRRKAWDNLDSARASAYHSNRLSSGFVIFVPARGMKRFSFEFWCSFELWNVWHNQASHCWHNDVGYNNLNRWRWNKIGWQVNKSEVFEKNDRNGFQNSSGSWDYFWFIAAHLSIVHLNTPCFFIGVPGGVHNLLAELYFVGESVVVDCLLYVLQNLFLSGVASAPLWIHVEWIAGNICTTLPDKNLKEFQRKNIGLGTKGTDWIFKLHREHPMKNRLQAMPTVYK